MNSAVLLEMCGPLLSLLDWGCNRTQCSCKVRVHLGHLSTSSPHRWTELKSKHLSNSPAAMPGTRLVDRRSLDDSLLMVGDLFSITTVLLKMERALQKAAATEFHRLHGPWISIGFVRFGSYQLVLVDIYMAAGPFPPPYPD